MNSTNLVNYLEKSLPQTLFVSEHDSNTTTIFVPHQDLHNVAFFLNKNSNLQYKVLTDVTAVDWLGRDTDKFRSNEIESFTDDQRLSRILQFSSRFCLIYNFLSCHYNHRIVIKTFVDSNTPVASLCSLYKSANWWERETWDMFGIMFVNHPDLRRLLTDYGFEGFPLRKDFPLSGHVEIRYDENEKKIVSDPVEFSQEFRNFDYTTPWIS
jgi:NADH/F420H2 dehydrogenase subunit C